jgi:hypothetical protein
MRTYILPASSIIEANIKKVNDKIVVYLVMYDRHISTLKTRRNELYNNYYSGKLSLSDFKLGIEQLIQSIHAVLNTEFIETFIKNPAYRQDITQLQKTYGNFVQSLTDKKNKL